MGKLAATSCETAKSDPKRDRLLGDGDGLLLRVRPHGTKTWVIEYEFQGRRTKYTIGTYSRDGAPGNSIPDWLRFGQQSLTQSRSIAGNWKTARRAGHDPAAEWEALLTSHTFCGDLRHRDSAPPQPAAEISDQLQGISDRGLDVPLVDQLPGERIDVRTQRAFAHSLERARIFVHLFHRDLLPTGRDVPERRSDYAGHADANRPPSAGAVA
jgi:hypothetical protein